MIGQCPSSNGLSSQYLTKELLSSGELVGNDLSAHFIFEDGPGNSSLGGSGLGGGGRG